MTFDIYPIPLTSTAPALLPTQRAYKLDTGECCVVSIAKSKQDDYNIYLLVECYQIDPVTCEYLLDAERAQIGSSKICTVQIEGLAEEENNLTPSSIRADQTVEIITRLRNIIVANRAWAN